MKIASLTVRSKRPIQAIDVTDLVLSGPLPDGIALATVPHTTAALMLSESDDELLEDLESVAGQWSSRYPPFRHQKNDNPNGPAHLFAAIAGSQVLIPCVAGEAQLGRYQRLVLVELDGPKERTVDLYTLGAGRGAMP